MVRANRKNLLSVNPSNLLTTTEILLASCELRMLSVTFIVKSNSTRSIRGKALNHTPVRMAFVLRLANCVIVKAVEGIVCAKSLTPDRPLIYWLI